MSLRCIWRNLAAGIAIGACLYPTILTTAAEARDSGPKPRLRVGSIDQEWFHLEWKPPDKRAEEFELESSVIGAYPGRALRWSNLLALKLENGKFVWLTDMGDDSVAGFRCCEFYKLRDFWADLGFYVVQIRRGENGGYLLISAKTADFVETVAEPHRASEHSKLIVSVMADDMSGYAAEIWRLEGSAWRRVYGCDRLVYGTDFLRWEAPNRVILKASTQGSPREFDLSERNGRWQTTACLK